MLTKNICRSLLMTAVISSLGVTAANATIFNGDLFFTTYTPEIPVSGQANANVGKVAYSYNDATPLLTLAPITPIARTNGADGIVFDPNTNHLIIGGQGGNSSAPIHEVNQTVAIDSSNPSGNNVISVAANAGSGAYHLSVSPDGKFVYVGGIPGDLGKVALPLAVAGTAINVTGAVSGVDTLAWANGKVFFTSSNSSGIGGTFGEIDLATGVTTAKISNIEAHGMAFDAFSGKLMVFGDDTVSMIDPTAPTSVFDSIVIGSGSSLQIDQGSVDGLGHLFLADNNSHLLFLDYAATGKVSTNSYLYNQPFITHLDDLAPLSGPGSQQAPEPALLALFGIGLGGLAVARRKKMA